MLRPRVSTSAGQSVGGAVVTVLVLDGVVDAVEPGAFMDLARAEKAVLLEQVRQLSSGVSCCRDQIRGQIQKHTACRRARGRRLAAAASRALSQRRWHGRLPATRCAVVPQPCFLLCSFVWRALSLCSGRWTEMNRLPAVASSPAWAGRTLKMHCKISGPGICKPRTLLRGHVQKTAGLGLGLKL